MPNWFTAANQHVEMWWLPHLLSLVGTAADLMGFVANEQLVAAHGFSLLVRRTFGEVNTSALWY